MNTLKIGDIFRNSNGNDYLVLAVKPEQDYTLLFNLGERYCRFNCAWGVNPETRSWAQGHYFGTIEDAVAYWEGL